MPLQDQPAYSSAMGYGRDPEEERRQRMAMRQELNTGSLGGGLQYGQSSNGSYGYDAAGVDSSSGGGYQAADNASAMGAMKGGGGGAMKANPWAIAAQVAMNYLKNDQEKHKQRREFSGSVAADRAGRLGYPTYGLQGARLRYEQTYNRPGTVDYDPMGG